MARSQFTLTISLSDMSRNDVGVVLSALDSAPHDKRFIDSLRTVDKARITFLAPGSDPLFRAQAVARHLEALGQERPFTMQLDSPAPDVVTADVDPAGQFFFTGTNADGQFFTRHNPFHGAASTPLDPDGELVKEPAITAATAPGALAALLSLDTARRVYAAAHQMDPGALESGDHEEVEKVRAVLAQIAAAPDSTYSRAGMA